MICRYKLPKRYSDLGWLNSRLAINQDASKTKCDIEIDFSDCIWIDLHPLIDLLLQLMRQLSSGKSIHLKFSEKNRLLEPPGRVSRFLDETGFLSSLQCAASKCSGELRYLVGEDGGCFTNHESFVDSVLLAKKVLDTVTVLPCLVGNVSRLESRDDVFSYCKKVREEFCSRSILTAKLIPAPLINETKLFFNSILPELIDNVRLHKSIKDGGGDYAVFIRLRKREEARLGSGTVVAESSYIERTVFQRKTAHLWQHDVIEAVFCDQGESIQETWIEGWRIAHAKSRKRVPRMPESNVRVDGKDGDVIILKGVFTENTSSLSKRQRAVEGLPLKATGLNSIRKAIADTNCSFAVRSGLNYISALPVRSEEREHSSQAVTVDKAGRFNRIDGVHFLFKLAALSDRPLSNWANGVPSEGLIESQSWWNSVEKNLLEYVQFVDDYSIPERAEKDDVLVCRPHHLIAKRELIQFLNKCVEKGVFVIFAEMPAAFALRLANYLEILNAETDLPFWDLTIPIVTTSLRVKVISRDEKLAVRSFINEEVSGKAFWWEGVTSPIRCLKDLFIISRMVDTDRFWSIVKSVKGAFLREPVKWANEVVLCGGYLFIKPAFRLPELRRLVKRRLQMLVEQTDSTLVAPASDSMRKISSEVERDAYFSRDGTERIAIIGSVKISGRTIENASRKERRKSTVNRIALLVYPEDLVANPPGYVKNKGAGCYRVFDWNPSYDSFCEADWENTRRHVRFVRIANSEQVREKNDGPVPVYSYQTPADSYRTWQRQDLLGIGHYSYESHHYYVWMDLRGFLLQKTPESIELIDRMLEKLREWSPAWIFYKSHETAEILIDRLCDEDGSGADSVIGHERTWPIDDLGTFVDFRAETGFLQSQLDSHVAVFIDDAMVSGATIRDAKADLTRIGFKTVYSMVILNRMSPESGVLSKSCSEEEHFSWWDQLIPPAGDENSCRICKGLGVLRAISGSTKSEPLRGVLETWSEFWAERDHLERFSAAIEGKVLSKCYVKRLGDLNPDAPGIRLISAEALCAWGLDLSNRLGLPSFFLSSNEKEHDLGEALTESLAGILLHNWKALPDTDKGLLVDRILLRFWVETRSSARALIAISLLSLGEDEMRAVAKRVGDQIAEYGLVNAEAAAFAYTVAHRVSKMPEDLQEQLLTWANNVESKALGKQTDLHMQTRALVSTLAAAGTEDNLAIFALQILGLPGRGSIHQYLYSLLQKIQEADQIGEKEMELLALVRAYLDPVRRCVERYRRLFSEEDFYDHIEGYFCKLDSLLAREDNKTHHRDSGVISKEDISGLMRDITAVCKTDYRGLTNIRVMLARENVHYLPYLVRECIFELNGAQEHNVEIEVGDFLVEAAFTQEERSLFDEKFPAEGREKELAIERLHIHEVAVMPKEIAIPIIKDMLVDVVHAKKEGFRLGRGKNAPYMTISFSKDAHYQGKPAVEMSFANRASPKQFGMSHGNTWSVVWTLIRSIGGVLRDDYIEGKLVRTAVFPSLRPRVGV